MAMKAQLIMMVMMINALNNVRSVKETVIRHMDEPKFKLMLYRAGAINVTSTECTNQPCKTRTDKQIKKHVCITNIILRLELLICLKSKWSRDSNITKQTESISFWKSISVLFTCTITCTDGSYECSSISNSSTWFRFHRDPWKHRLW